MKRAVKVVLFVLGGILVVGLMTLLPSVSKVAQSAEMMHSEITVDPFYASPKGAIVGSTLIESDEEVILVDSQYTLSEANRLADKISATGKSLKMIWISHAHPDHFLGLEALLNQFPNTPVYSTTAVVTDIQQRADNFLAGAQQNYGDDAASKAIIPEAYDSNTLKLGGKDIKVLSMQGDTANTAVLYIPSIDTVIAPDVVYWGTHLFMIETLSEEAQDAWLQSINTIRTLDPKVVIPGHKTPGLDLANSLDGLDAAEDYIQTFASVIKESETAEEAIAALTEAYPDYGLPFIMNISVNAAYSSGGAM